MGTIAVVGEAVRTRGFGVAGAMVFEADTAADVIDAWESLPDDVVAVILTPDAAAALRSRHRDRDGADGRDARYTVVMPP
jgi:vacuolar-type H+-ATPase subunit F/Vma7